MTTEQRVKNVLDREMGLDIEHISLDDTLEDLDLDSLDKVELCMEIEKEFNLSIPDEELENFYTVRNIVEYLDDAIKHHQL